MSKHQISLLVGWLLDGLFLVVSWLINGCWRFVCYLSAGWLIVGSLVVVGGMPSCVNISCYCWLVDGWLSTLWFEVRPSVWTSVVIVGGLVSCGLLIGCLSSLF